MALGVMTLSMRAIVRIDQRQSPDLLVRSVGEDDRFGEVAVEDLVARERLGETRIVNRRRPQIVREVGAGSHRLVLDPLDLAFVAGARDLDRVLEHVRARFENQNSRPLWKSTDAKMATSTVGTTAITENKATRRTCKRPLPRPASLGAPDGDLASVKHHQRNRRKQVGDQQQRDQWRDSRCAGLAPRAEGTRSSGAMMPTRKPAITHARRS